MDYPQWLLPTYIRSARAAGATASDEEITAVAKRLIARWSEPDRHHHDVHHLCDMLSRITTLAPETHQSELVFLAAFYHGCVFSTADRDTYTRNGGEKEVESASVARAELSAIGVPEETVDRIAALIVGLKKQPKEVDPTASTTLSTIDIDKLALRDAHLGALAAGPQKYTKYLGQVAQEYSHVPEADFLQARKEIIGRLLARRQIFLTPLGRQWETAARDNLEGELERIEGRLAAIRGSDPHPLEERLAEEQQGLGLKDAAKARPDMDHPLLAPEQDEDENEEDRSSLETMPEDMESGASVRALDAEQSKKAERQEIARRMQERIARRQAGLDEGTTPAKTAAPDTPTAPDETPSPVTPPSAPTPEWDDEVESARAGFEREPDY
ncbi:hypothetical protein [Flaviflexus huanghaiensis]|uniref:HD domain-containing protein n=1 Tax=Flaviflexus huanghaiensis TaxID=1111473 RepID=UPI0015FCFF1E|nr:hypothetical protein [Flaviflexus huanghaiensis]